MINVVQSNLVGNTDKRSIVTCNSYDAKPQKKDGIFDGSICMETDTGNFYIFNESSNRWVKLASNGGGGGGEGGITPEIVYTSNTEKFNFEYLRQRLLEGKEIIIRELYGDLESGQAWDYRLKLFNSEQMIFCCEFDGSYWCWIITSFSAPSKRTGASASVEYVNTEIGEIDDSLSLLHRSVSALWKLEKGQIYDYEEVSSLGDVTVPSGAMDYASLVKLGGMSRKGTNLTVLALVNGQSAGVAYTRVEDDIFSMVGTRDGSSGKVIMRADDIPNGSYMIKEESVRGDITNVRYAVTGVKDGATTTLYSTVNSNVELTINGNDFDNVRISAKLRSDGDSIDADLKVWLVKSENANVPYEPHTESLIDAPVDKVVSVGANFFDISKLSSSEITVEGNTIIQTSDNDNLQVISNMISTEELLNKIITVGFDPSSTARMRIRITSNGANQYINITEGRTINFSAYPNVTDIKIGFRGTAKGQKLVNPYAVIGDVQYTFAPYREPIEKPIPQSIIDLCPDYGIGVNENVYNYIDFETKTYHRRVTSLTKSFNVTRKDSSEKLWNCGVLPNSVSVDLNDIANFIIRDYVSDSLTSSRLTEYSACIYESTLYINDSSFTDSFTKELTIYYELATEEVIDLSSVWTKDLDILEVEANGSVTFEYPNKETYKVDVPNTIEYIVKLSEVN